MFSPHAWVSGMRLSAISEDNHEFNSMCMDSVMTINSSRCNDTHNFVLNWAHGGMICWNGACFIALILIILQCRSAQLASNGNLVYYLTITYHCEHVQEMIDVPKGQQGACITWADGIPSSFFLRREPFSEKSNLLKLQLLRDGQTSDKVLFISWTTLRLEFTLQAASLRVQDYFLWTIWMRSLYWNY